MRPLELLTLITLVPVIGGFFFRRPTWFQMFSWLALILMMAHLLLEKYRWQMVPAYLLTLLLFAVGLKQGAYSGTKPSGWRTLGCIAGVMLGFLVLAATAFLALRLPVFTDPPTTGPFAVGTTQLHFVDASREDPFAPKWHTPRELLVVVWYPADVTAGARPQPCYPDVWAWGPQSANQFHLITGLPVPSFINSHWGLVKSHSYLDMPVARAQARYPVLIFSHGYGGWTRQNTPQMEELASHGFVVFSIGHTYESGAIAFPDGRVVPYSQSQFKALIQPSKTDPLAQLDQRLQLATNAVEIRQVLAKMTQVSSVAESLALWVADTQYLIDELAKVSEGAERATNRFAKRLDLARLGVFGMSFGGGTAGAVCLKDPRCKAGLNLDGRQFGDFATGRLTVPFLYFSHDGGSKENDAAYQHSLGDCYCVRVNHSGHGNFMDAGLGTPLFKNTPLFGSIDGQEMERIMNAYTLAFFQKYLEGKTAPLLEGPPAGKFPEVVFTARKAANPTSRPE